MKDVISKVAKENQACGQGGVLLFQNSDKASEKIDTKKELAKIAGGHPSRLGRSRGS